MIFLIFVQQMIAGCVSRTHASSRFALFDICQPAIIGDDLSSAAAGDSCISISRPRNTQRRALQIVEFVPMGDLNEPLRAETARTCSARHLRLDVPIMCLAVNDVVSTYLLYSGSAS